MALRFLSPEWIDALDAAAREATVPAELHMTLQQVVRDGEREVRYHLEMADGALRVHAGRAQAPDVTLSQTRDVAVALSRGELNAQTALATGHLKLSGNLDLLLRHARALTFVDDVFAAVREQTEY